MQTFLPFSSFTTSAVALDNKRLNKQILEGYQILNTLSGQSVGWRNHPAVKMWYGFEQSLFKYINAMIIEANHRGIKTDKNQANLNVLKSKFWDSWRTEMPYWYNEPTLNRITTTHRANLYAKDPEYYIDFIDSVSDPNNIPCCDTCKYFWVTHLDRQKVS